MPTPEPEAQALEGVPTSPDPGAVAPVETPLLLVLSFGIPVFMVVLWFMIRLFTGRWINEPIPALDPPPPGDALDPTHPGLAEDEGTG